VAGLSKDLLERAQKRMIEMLEDCVERSRLSPEPLPVIVVGGGSILVNGPIGGLEIIKPSAISAWQTPSVPPSPRFRAKWTASTHWPIHRP
jgi:hypothetical protein